MLVKSANPNFTTTCFLTKSYQANTATTTSTELTEHMRTKTNHWNAEFGLRAAWRIVDAEFPSETGGGLVGDQGGTEGHGGDDISMVNTWGRGACVEELAVWCGSGTPMIYKRNAINYTIFTPGMFSWHSIDMKCILLKTLVVGTMRTLQNNTWWRQQLLTVDRVSVLSKAELITLTRSAFTLLAELRTRVNC